MTFISGTRHGHPATLPVDVAQFQIQNLRRAPQPCEVNEGDDELPVWIRGFDQLFGRFQSDVVAFFKVDRCLVPAIGKRSGLLSVLALSGVNHAPEADGTDDGILTADEISFLRLEGVDLVGLRNRSG